MSYGPKPVAQLVVERPDGCKLIQGLLIADHLADVVRRLAPLVPHDAVWQVVDGDAHP